MKKVRTRALSNEHVQSDSQYSSRQILANDMPVAPKLGPPNVSYLFFKSLIPLIIQIHGKMQPWQYAISCRIFRHFLHRIDKALHTEH